MRGLAVSTLLAGFAIVTAAHAGPPAPTFASGPSPAQANPSPAVPAPSAMGTERARRAQAHLEAVLQGRVAINELSPQDLQDVLDLDRALRGGITDNRTFAQQCVDEEVRRNGGAPSRLAWEVIKLKCQ